MSVNKAIIIGHLGHDPSIRYLESGSAVCHFSVATTEKYKNKAGEKVEDTQWHNCVVFGKLAEVCAEWLHKGSLAYFEGRMKLEKWTGKDGTEKSATKIVVSEMRMLGGKSEGKTNSGAGADSGMKPGDPFEGMPPVPDDDIPF